MKTNTLTIFAPLFLLFQHCHAHNIPLTTEVVQKACSEKREGSKSNWFSFYRTPGEIKHLDGNRSVWMVVFFAEEGVRTDEVAERDLSECARSAFINSTKEQRVVSNDELRDATNECLSSRAPRLMLRGVLVRRGEIECNIQEGAGLKY